MLTHEYQWHPVIPCLKHRIGLDIRPLPCWFMNSPSGCNLSFTYHITLVYESLHYLLTLFNVWTLTTLDVDSLVFIHLSTRIDHKILYGNKQTSSSCLFRAAIFFWVLLDTEEDFWGEIGFSFGYFCLKCIAISFAKLLSQMHCYFLCQLTGRREGLFFYKR